MTNYRTKIPISRPDHVLKTPTRGHFTKIISTQPINYIAILLYYEIWTSTSNIGLSGVKYIRIFMIDQCIAWIVYRYLLQIIVHLCVFSVVAGISSYYRLLSGYTIYLIYVYIKPIRFNFLDFFFKENCIFKISIL